MTDQTFETLQDWYHWFPDSFWEAHEAGRPATHNPHHEEVMAAFGETLYLHDTDSDRWSTATYHTEYETRNGQFSIIVYTDYECGDSDPHETYVVAGVEAAKKVEESIYADFQAAKNRQLKLYYEWVAERGEDPLEEFLGLKPFKTVKKKYQIKVRPYKGGPDVNFESWRRPRGAWRHPRYAPHYVHEYLAADSDAFSGTYILGKQYIDPDDEECNENPIRWDSITEDIGENIDRWVKLPDDDPDVLKHWWVLAFEVELEEEVPVRNYKRKLQWRARVALHELKRG